MASVLPNANNGNLGVSPFLGSSQASNALDRARTLRFVVVIVDQNVDSGHVVIPDMLNETGAMSPFGPACVKTHRLF